MNVMGVHNKKELPLAGCNLWLSPDLAHSKSELKSLIESNGGKLCSRLSAKVNFAVSRRKCEGLTEKINKHFITIIPDSFVLECVKTNTSLFIYTSQHLNPQKENNPNPPANIIASSSTLHSPTLNSTQTSLFSSSSPNIVYNNVSELEPPLTRTRSIRDRLKRLSLISSKSTNNNNNKPPSSPSSSPPHSPTKAPASPTRTKLRNATRALRHSFSLKKDDEGRRDTDVTMELEKHEEGDNSLPLHNLVFVIYGTFSMPNEVVESLIVVNGGKFVSSICDGVTHILFGGEDMDAEALTQAQQRNIHIVNEYFLRLLIRY